MVRRALVLAFALCGVYACTRAPGTTTVTSGDVDSAVCLCRLPQDDGLSCCQSGIEMTCRCTLNQTCSLIASGQTCGRAPPARPRR